MSGLAGLLAGHAVPGVYTWHAAFAVDDVRRTVEHGGARFGHLDGWTHQTKEEVLVGLGEALRFPEHYGRNLDALADCLGDLTEPVVLLWDGWGTLARADRATFDVVLEICGSSSPLPFSVLLRGEGPDLDVASLDG